MKSWKRKLLRRAAIVLLLLLVAQTGTYFLFARRLTPRRLLSQSNAFRQADFVLISSRDSIDAGQRSDLVSAYQPYVRSVYYSLKDVPAERVVYKTMTVDERERWRKLGLMLETKPGYSAPGAEIIRMEVESGQHWAGLDGGYAVGVWIESEGPFWMRGGGETAGGYRSDTYLWLFGGWVRIWSHGGAVF
jgi:hypothetical protein